jgi:hypothetical protein
MKKFDVVFAIQAHNCIAFCYKINIHDAAKSFADMKLTDQMSVKARVQPKNSSLIINILPFVLPETKR